MISVSELKCKMVSPSIAHTTYPEHLCSMQMQYTWIFPAQQYPIYKKTKQLLMNMDVKNTDHSKVTYCYEIQTTHIWREKGTPDISNLSISKSTPMVAL